MSLIYGFLQVKKHKASWMNARAIRSRSVVQQRAETAHLSQAFREDLHFLFIASTYRQDAL